eukprot:m.262431 g.262431  ORF g.262431 m.262431 type:complete len:869 (+) comp16222_c1_seq24:245-2851(+)
MAKLLLLLLPVFTTAGNGARLLEIVESTASCSTVTGYDFDGHDIDRLTGVTSADECCQHCFNFTGCKFFSYDTSGSKVCYLKNVMPKPDHNPSRISGSTMPLPPFPPPPPPSPPSPPVPPGESLYACKPPYNSFKFCDTTLDYMTRARLLVSNLSVSEQVGIVNKGGVSRLGIPSYDMWSTESLHGVRLWPEKCPFPDKCTTIFPPASTSSRSFNKTAYKAIGQVMGLEGRVLFNLGIINTLSLRGPQMNLQRDPRWGRNSNSASECPIHSGIYGQQIISGMQGDDSIHLISAEMKHWTAYAVESNRFGFNGNISLYDMGATFMVPLKMALKSNVSAAMCSYNAINGTPSCANHWMNSKVLRDAWGFEGVMESDCGALSNINSHFHYTKDGPHTAAAAMEGTCDVECDSVYSKYLPNALSDGILDPAYVLNASYRILLHRFKLGMFDDPTKQAYFTGIYNTSDSVHSNTSAALALDIAQQSIAMVQNGAQLPWTCDKLKGKTLAVVGPSANITDVFLGDYRPAACPGPAMAAPEGTNRCKPTALQVFGKRLENCGTKIVYAPGCVDGPPCTKLDMDSFNNAIQGADYVLAFVGEKSTDNDNQGNTDGEGHDRATIALPGCQSALTNATVTNGKPAVVVILSGGSVSVDVLKSDTALVSVLYAGYGGESGPESIADIVMGNVNPSGRLPFTVYSEKWEAGVPFTDMSMQTGYGRTYRYLNSSLQPLWKFGDGMSYTSFALKSSNWNTLQGSLPTSACVSVSNEGKMDGSDVVIAYFKVEQLTAAPAGLAMPSIIPNMQLFDFDKKFIRVGESEQFCFDVTEETLGLYDNNGNHALYAGKYSIILSDGNSNTTMELQVDTPATLGLLPQP